MSVTGGLIGLAAHVHGGLVEQAAKHPHASRLGIRRVHMAVQLWECLFLILVDPFSKAVHR